MSRASAVTREWTLARLAKLVAGQSEGNPNRIVTRVAELSDATPDSITYYSSRAHAQQLKNTQAGIVILRARDRAVYVGDCIISEQPRLAFAQVIEVLHPSAPHGAGIHSTAVIGEHSQIDASVVIGPNTVIGNHVKLGANVSIKAGTVIEDSVEIGEGTQIDSQVVIYRHTTIGGHCRFSSGVILGAPGFSFEWDGERWVSVRNIGTLVIGDDVDVGACTSIDRASISATRVHDGVRIDNNCHIGHNVEIGKHTLIIAGVGIGGGARIGKRCIIGGHSAIRDNILIADDVTILGTSLVTKSITKAGEYSSAVPAREAKEWNHSLAMLNKLQPA